MRNTVGKFMSSLMSLLLMVSLTVIILPPALLGSLVFQRNLSWQKKHQSCVAGHQQGFQVATGYRADGTRLTSIIAGSCYEHNEDYMGPQGNNHWRGCLMLHNVEDGQFDLVQVPLGFLERKYG